MESWLGATLLLLGLVAGYHLGRARARRSRPPPEPEAREGTAGAQTPQVVVQTGGTSTGRSYLVEELFLLAGDGRLMVHLGQLVEESDLVGSMLTAISDFVKESFHHKGYLGAIDHGDNRILVESGRWVKLAVVIYGQDDEALRELMNSTVALIEGHLQDVLEEWDGDAAPVRRARELLSPIIMATAGVTREQVETSTRKASIRLNTGWEFVEGLVKLQLQVHNRTPTPLHSCRLTLAYNPTRLNLAGVEPPNLVLEGATISLGQLLPQSRTELLLILDLFDCNTQPVELNLLYQTSSEEAHQMAARRLELICPASFNPYNANPAMARRYLQTSLPHRDATLLPLPGNLQPQDFYHLLRYGLAQLEILSVCERRCEQPIHFEGWYTTLELPASGEVRGPLPFLFKTTLDVQAGTLELLLASPDLQSLETAKTLTFTPLQNILDRLSAKYAIEV